MNRLSLLSVSVALLASINVAHAQISNTFTYQGELRDGGAVANGAFDIRFTLLNRDTGAPVGTAVCLDQVDVVDGRFTAELNFGVAPENANHELQLMVRAGASGTCPNLSGFVILSPNQPVTAAPFALTAKRATDSDRLGGLLASAYTSAGSLVSGTLADARLSTNVPRLNSGTNQTFSGPTSFANSVQMNAASIQNLTVSGGSFAGTGSGLTNLNASNIATGTVADARLSANIPRLNAPTTFLSNLTVNGTLQASSLQLSTPVQRTRTLQPMEFANGSLIPSSGDPMLLFNSSLTLTFSSDAPFQLPEGATITAVRFTGIDDASNNMTALIIRRGVAGTGGGTMSQIVTSGSSAAVRTFSDTTISAPVIDNNGFYYFARIEIEPTSFGTLEAYSLRIDYTVNGVN